MKAHIFRERRQALGMTQQQLAEALGQSKRQIGRYEAGKTRVPGRTIKLFEAIAEKRSAQP